MERVLAEPIADSGEQLSQLTDDELLSYVLLLWSSFLAIWLTTNDVNMILDLCKRIQTTVDDVQSSRMPDTFNPFSRVDLI